MIFGKTKLELKVGIFVFMGLVILAMFVLWIGKFRALTSGYEIKVIFNFVNGVKIGAPVRFAGVDAGEVKTIKFYFLPQEQKTKVQVAAWVRSKVRIPRDSDIWINTLGLLGEKYIEIIPGKNYADCLRPHEELVGVDPLPMHEVTRLAKDIASNIDEVFIQINRKEGTVGKLIYDDAIYKELEALVTDVRKNPWKLFIKTKEKK